MRMLSLWLVLTGTAVAQVPSGDSETTEADEARARQLYENGQTLYTEGAYEAAVLAFEESYRLSGRAPLLFNIGNAHERAGNLEGALDAFNRYRAFAQPSEAEALSRRVSALERRIREEAANQPVEPATVAEPSVAGPTVPDPSVAAATVSERPPITTTQRTAAAKVMTPVGAIAAVGFGTLAAVTFAQGNSWESSGNQDAWETWRPVNNASVVLAGTGAAVALTGLLLPKKTVTQPQTAMSPTSPIRTDAEAL